MKKSYFIFLVLLVVNINLQSSEWISFDNSDNTTPEYILIQSNNSFVEFEVTVPGMNSLDVDTYQRLNIHEHTRMNITGSPEVPVVSFLIAIPECGDLDFNISALDSTVVDSMNIYPAPQLVEVTSPEGYSYLEEQFLINTQLYNTNEYFPGFCGELLDRGAVRAQHCIRVNIYPVQFNPVLQQLIAYSRLYINITFSEVTGQINEDVGFFNEVCGNSMINYNSNGLNASINCGVSNVETEEPQWVETFSDFNGKKYISQNCDYLIVTHHDLWNNQHIQLLAEKRADFNGLNVVIVKMSDIHNQIPIPVQPYDKLLTLIQNTYNYGTADHTFDNKLGYVNLFGDTKMQNQALHPIPTHEEGDDTYFSQLTIPPGATGADPYPDIMIGRCSVDNTEQVENIVTKILNYEPLEANPANEWRNRSLTILGSDDTSNFHYCQSAGLSQVNDFLSTDENNIFVPSSYYSYGLTIPSSYVEQQCQLEELQNYYNDKNIFVNYLGHGHKLIWGNDWLNLPYIEYETINNSFVTDNQLPIVSSFSCLTGAFHDNNPYFEDCIGERFLCNSSTSGSIAFIGAPISVPISCMNYTYPHFTKSLNHYGLYVVGEALMATKLLDGSNIAMNFNLLGDPALNCFVDQQNIGLPDMKIEEHFITYDFDYPNYENCNLAVNIINNSPNPVNNTFSVNIYYKESMSSQDLQLIHNEQIYALGAGENYEITHTWNAGYDNIGYKYIVVIIDEETLIDERNEINNEAIKEIIITNENQYFPITISNLAITDIDLFKNENINKGDLSKELIVGCNLIDPNSPFSNWFTDYDVSSSVIGDLNNDRIEELYIVMDNTQISRINTYNGTLDNDFIILDIREASLSTDNNYLYSIEKDISENNFLKKYNFDSSYSIMYDFTNIENTAPKIPPAICDVNNDGINDILVMFENTYVISGNNGEILYTNNYNSDDAIFADLDKDGYWEVITFSNNDNSSNLIVDNIHFGATIINAEIPLENIKTIITADIDDDDNPEIILKTDTKIRVFDYQINNFTYECDINSSNKIILSGNIDSDPFNEIICINNDPLHYEKNTPLLIEPHNSTSKYLYTQHDPNSILLTKVDEDERLELLANYSNVQLDYSILHSFEFNFSDNNIEWGQYRHDAQNTACYDTRVYELEENSDIIWSNKIIVKNDLELPESSTLTITPGTVITFEENKELIVFGEIIAHGTQENHIIIKAIQQNAGNQYWDGITLMNSSHSSFKHCIINNATNGLFYMNIEEESPVVELCELYNNYIGINCFSSAPLIKENIIRDNAIGIACTHDSSPILTDFIHENRFKNGIINNQSGITIDRSIAYIKNGFNDIYSSLHNSIYIEMHNPDIEFSASQNYWGTTDINEIYEHLIPSESYNIFPICTSPQSNYIPQRDLQFAMIKNAYQALDNEDYTIAVQTFKDVIDQFPETSESYVAIPGLFTCTKRSTQDWDAFEIYLSQVAQDTIRSEKYLKLIDCYFNISKRERQDYDTAIANYESELLNNPTYEDSVYAVIDIGNTYIEAGLNGRSATGSMSQLQPESIKKHVSNSRNLLLSFYKQQGNNNTPEIYKYELKQNYPNPFNPETTISFSIPIDGKVDLSIYNIKGQKVKTLVHDELERGSHQVIWNSKDNTGKSVATGIYFYKMSVNSKDKSIKKMLLLK